MLFHFRTPRTRDWNKYLKKMQKVLDSNEETAYLTAFLLKAQESRSVLVKLLDECAKDVSRPDDIIKILNEYLPILEQLIEGFEANNIKLVGCLDIVWTSFLMTNINGKSLSNTLLWEKVCCYTLLGLAHYQKAVELHHLNRQISHKKKKQINAESNIDFDPIFDEPINNTSPQIYDDKDKVKQISLYLREAAGIWLFVSNIDLDSVAILATKQFDVIPESFVCCLSVLSTISLINAQEFMIQLAVQTNKSPSLTMKLSYGVSQKLKQCQKLLNVNLSANIYNSIKKDFILYLKIRSDLYQAIALKYNAKLLKANEKHGLCVAYYQSAINILKHSINKFPNNQNDKNKNNQTSSIIVMKKSINKQMQSVKALFNAARSENNSVYFEVVPKLDQIEHPEPKFVIKVDEYKSNWQDL